MNLNFGSHLGRHPTLPYVVKMHLIQRKQGLCSNDISGLEKVPKGSLEL